MFRLVAEGLSNVYLTLSEAVSQAQSLGKGSECYLVDNGTERLVFSCYANGHVEYSYWWNMICEKAS